jgi:SAM-dependent methyltransferase
VQSLELWEARWAPYDEPTYRAALSYVQPDDIVLDIGAGDLRLARRVAETAARVFAIERQPDLLSNVANSPRAANLRVICADARQIPWPPGVTLGVLLMRHCTHFELYAKRLRASGCRRLVTNARWGMAVELVDLGPRLAWNKVDVGWYACLCGQTGFMPGPPDQLTAAVMERVSEVEQCPGCEPGLVG